MDLGFLEKLLIVVFMWAFYMGTMGAVCWALWNYGVAAVFTQLPTMTYLQAVLVVWFFRIVLSK